eukprot:CAMPEP_0182420576 /NCGR_PEP_ID=MMETSP1167-20130531/5480_1 /TAXON_ID=2988 /ORGANISM="Mallomonas Sp, Strain CCMP3275" /LENGTH=380 /DNA_ID=CAMNT_0024596723 /DNA_START=44 /DNA_END=1186 /DNA_ORIENTATION=+
MRESLPYNKSSEGDSETSDKNNEQHRVETSSDGGRHGSSSTEQAQSSETEIKSSDGTAPSSDVVDMSYSASVSAYSDTNSFCDGAQSDEVDNGVCGGTGNKRERDQEVVEKDLSSSERDASINKRRKSQKDPYDSFQCIEDNNNIEEDEGNDEGSYSFREQVSSLREDNGHLMLISMSQNDPYPFTERILGDCDVKLPESVASAVQLLISRIEKAEIAALPLKNVMANKKSFCLTNASTFNNVIVYVSRSFLQMSGYAAADVLGKPCNILHGPETDMKHVEEIKSAFMTGNEVRVVMRNYHADGSIFMNDFQMSPLRDSVGRVLLFLVIQTEVMDQDMAITAKQLQLQLQSDSATSLLQILEKGPTLASPIQLQEIEFKS